jgi:hypothetical protein
VETKNVFVHHRGERQVVEEVREQLPHAAGPVLPHAFIEKSIDLGDLATLVVAAEQVDAIWEAGFKAKKEAHGFYGVVTTVYVIAHK